ncbi:MAG: hypothetical protein ACOCRO_10925 [Halanaerobiales bacterium]
MATKVYSHTAFPEEMSEYVVGKIMTAESEVYVIIASGKGHWAANEDDITYFELITLELEQMEMGMVTIDTLKEGLAAYGRMAIYNIYFDTGESEIKEESAEALGIIAEFLKEHTTNKYLNDLCFI